MAQKKVRVRFVPPPGERLRLDSARVALVNRLFARQQEGEFILRLGESDSEESLIKDLRWMKLLWEEGPDIGGSYGPYKQSLRKKTYHRYAQNLVSNGQAYPCYCTGEELARRTGRDLNPGARLNYDNHCRDLSTAERRKLEKEGRHPVIRFKLSPRKLAVRDLLRGEMNWDTSGMEDFIIMNSFARPAPAFAAVLDDSLMEISHVIDYQDLLRDLPERLLLFEALGFPVPRFAGMGELLGPNHRPLGGEKEDFVEYYRREGYLPEGLLNYLACPEGRGAGEEILNLKRLAERFSLGELNSDSLILDRERLNQISGRAIRQADPERLTNLALPFLKKAGFLEEEISEEKYSRVKKAVASIRGRINSLGEIKRFASIFSSL